MTISTTASRISYNGNGATTAFSFPYRFLTNADLTVIRVAADGTETTLVLNTDYTVAGADEDAGGTVTIGTAPASGTRVVIFREIDITQEVDYITGDAFPAETHERAIDRLTMIAQQHQDAIDRSAKLSETSTADADTLIANINALAAIEDDVSDVAAIVSDVSDVAAIDANVTTVAGIAANVTTVAGIAANVTSVAGNATNINTVAGNNSNVTTVAGVSSAVTTVAGISSAVSTVAADGTDIGVVAGISADVQAVADIAADVAAVENIAANVTTVAGIAANVTTVAGISANVTTVAGNTTNINTVAGISANVTTVAGISADVTAVAADATDIGTVATNIADVNTVATDIADINTCADNMAAILDAPAQASAAAASAAAAAASLDNFDDRYLGSKSSAPTLDNDGNALVAGALYFNDGTIVADDKGMYVYDGGTWIAASAASQAILVKYKYVATAGQTTFTGTDANGLTLSYTAGSIIVTLNGVVMDAADYTATTGNSVVLGTAAALNDELGVFAFSTFDIANTYTQAQVDALLAGKIGTGSGTVSQSNLATNVAGTGPAFSAWIPAANQTIPTATFTKCALSTEGFDTNGAFDSTTNYRFQPQVAGYYQINASISIIFATTGTYEWLGVFAKNGDSDYQRFGNSYNSNLPSNPAARQFDGSVLMYMNGTTDYLELYAFQNTGVNATMIGNAVGKYTRMSGSLVRAA